jgi:AraC family transcriptional regulator
MDKLLLACHNFAWHAGSAHYGSATDNQPMDVTIKQQPELRVGTVRHIGPYARIGRAFERLAALMAGAKRPPNAQLLALYYDDPHIVGADQLRSDAAIAFPPGADVPAGLIERRVPAGKYASTIHTGSYEHLGQAWTSLREEIGRRGLRPSGVVSYEIYLNDPMSVPAGEQRTELFAPIE